MKKNYIIIFICLIFLIITLKVFDISYSYEISDLKDNSILIGNDIFDGYIGPNKLIKAALDYYIETKDETPVKLYKYNGKTIDNELSWSYLNDMNSYSQLSLDGVNQLEIRRFVHNAKTKLDLMDNEELESISSFKYDDAYYIFATDLKKIKNYSTKKLSGYLVYKNKEIINYNFDIDNKRYDNYQEPDLEVVKVSHFGAVGDGVTDDTIALRKAIDYVNQNGGKLLFDNNKTYLVSIQEEEINPNYPFLEPAALTIKSDKEIVVDLNNSTIKLIPNNFLRYIVLRINNSKNVIVKNGNIVGDRLEHDFSTQYKDDSGEYYAVGYCVRIDSNNYTNSMDVYLKDLKISYAIGDGILVQLRTKTSSTQAGSELYGNSLVIMDNIETFKNRRQGITLAASDKVIAKNIKINDIGDLKEDKVGIEYAGQDYTDSNYQFAANDLGIEPKSGIDIEPAYSNLTNDTIVFDNIELKDNDGYALVNGKDWFANKVKIYNSSLIGRTYFGNADVYDTYFENFTFKSQFHNTNIYNSVILNPVFTLLDNSTINQSNIYSNREIEKNLIRIENGALNNSIIENTVLSYITGNSLSGNNNNYMNVDAIFYINSLLDTNSNFKNSTITLKRVENDIKESFPINNLNFEDVTFNIEAPEKSVDFNNVSMENVIIDDISYNEKALRITNYSFTDSNLKNITIDGNGEQELSCSCQTNRTKFCLETYCYNSFVLNNSTLTNFNSDTYIPLTLNNSTLENDSIDDNMILNKESLCDNSKIIINKNIYSKDLLKDSKLVNNCIINLNNYNDSILLNIINGVENVDYKVNYNGDNKLN